MKFKTIPLLGGSSFEEALKTYWSKGIPELWILSVKILIFIRRNKKKDFILLRILLQIADLHLGDVDEDVYRGVCSEHQVVPPAHIPVTRAAPFSLWLRQPQWLRRALSLADFIDFFCCWRPRKMTKENPQTTLLTLTRHPPSPASWRARQIQSFDKPRSHLSPWHEEDNCGCNGLDLDNLLKEIVTHRRCTKRRPQ